MNDKCVRGVIVNFMMDIISIPLKDWEDQFKEVINDTVNTINPGLKTTDEVEKYLSFVLEYIEGSNKFFRKKKSGRIPYGKLLHHARKKEKFTEFMFELGVERKLAKKNDKPVQDDDITLAGFRYTGDEESRDAEIVIWKEQVYRYMYHNSVNTFFFNDGIVVKDSLGIIRSYAEYKKRASERKKNYTKLNYMWKVLKKHDHTDAGDEFISYYEGL